MRGSSERTVIFVLTVLLLLSAVASYFFSDQVLEKYGIIILLITLISILAGIAAFSYLAVTRDELFDPLDSVLDSDPDEK